MIAARGRLLLLTSDDPARPGGGREALSRLLHKALHDLYADVTLRRLTGRSRPLDGLRGRLNGLDAAGLAALAAEARGGGFDRVLIDGSNLGAAASAIARACPALPITTFFHNCETRFFADALRAGPGLRPLALLAGHARAEAMALRWSSQRIVLSARDSAELRRRFGQGGDGVLPMALEDRFGGAKTPQGQDAPYALFVGGGFFGNVGGLQWYARAIAPRLAIRTLVVGRGLEQLRGTLSAGMELIGAVDDLAPWYAGARVVVAPILAGSGMKTKVAEALMHGKSVVGTREAFSGYADDVVAGNHCHDDPQAFAEAVNRAAASSGLAFHPEQRAHYLRRHSAEAFRAGLAALLAVS